MNTWHDICSIVTRPLRTAIFPIAVRANRIGLASVAARGLKLARTAKVF